jgi:hypothetical protein
MDTCPQLLWAKKQLNLGFDSMHAAKKPKICPA